MSVSVAAVRHLDGQLGGAAVHSDEARFPLVARSRFPNLSVDWAPDVAVRCSGVADVMRCVTFARTHDLHVAVRGGGVGWVGAGAGSLLVDIQDLDGVWVDPVRRTVRVQGGCIWRDINRELAPFGLAAASPQFPRLGVAGHVLGGGHGWLTSRLGWAADTLRSVDVVTADGTLVHADAKENPDLFWALRGAGHNFGVAVALELDLIALDEVSFGIVWFHPDRTADALRLYRDWIPSGPDELTTIGSVGHPPRGWGGPAEFEGRAAAHVLVCHCGPAAQADADLRALRNHPAVVADSTRRIPWPTLAVGNDVFASGVHRRSRMHYLNDLTDSVIDISTRRTRELTALNFMSTHYYGGALRRIDEQATAMSHRGKPWNYMVAATWTSMENGDPVQRWQDDYLDEIGRHATGARYVNYLCNEPDQVSAAYHPATWQRLRDLKAAWDPTNVFRANQNIPPGGASPIGPHPTSEEMHHA